MTDSHRSSRVAAGKPAPSEPDTPAPPAPISGPPPHPRFELAHRDPGALVPDPSNPRRHPPKQIAALRASIQRFGFIVPILIRADGTVIAGHGRREAAIAEGLGEVPVWIAHHLADNEARAAMLADNRIAALGEWDQKQLAATLKSLEVAGVDLKPFDLALVSDKPDRKKQTDGKVLVEDAPLEAGFWISVKGPMMRQADALAALKALAAVPDVEVHSNVHYKSESEGQVK